MTSGRVLVVDDDHPFRETLANALRGLGYEVSSEPTGAAALSWLSHNDCEVLLLDLQLPDMSGIDVLRAARAEHPSVEVVLLTGHGSIENAIAAIRQGAFDYLSKPCSLPEVEITIEKALERRRLVERTSILSGALSPPDLGEGFVGQSARHREIVQLIDRVAASDASVLVLGETGVGKELVAKLIHTRSERRASPLVVVDCASLHENLLQSELFGHERGAYTGAAGLKHGLFEVADKGTIFLDEVGDVTTATQVKLLRVLEDHRFRRLGGTKDIRVDIRVVAATNRDLKELVARGHFRPDLFYRLSSITIDVPPLRSRPDDVPVLVQYWLSRFNARAAQQKTFTQEAMDLLVGYDWPGNVRQLVHVIERAVVLSAEPTIGPEGLPPDIGAARKNGAHARRPFGSQVMPLRDLERVYIEFALMQLEGHRGKTAAALGLSERSLYRKLKRYGLE